MITVDRKDLTEAVAFATRALPRATPIPALNGVRVTTTDGAVTVSAFDYDTYAEASIAQACTAGVDLLVPGRALASYLSGMRGTAVQVDHDDTTVRIACGSAKVSLPRLNLNDYPSAPDVPASVGTVDGEELAQAFASTVPAIDPNNAVVALRGYVLDSTDGLVVAGGSRFSFAVRQLTSWTGETFGQALTPTPIGDAARSLTGAVVLGRDSGRISLSTDDRCLTVRTIEGEPPAFRKLFDAHSPVTTMSVDRAEFAERLKWIALGDTRKETRGHCILTVGVDSVGIRLWGAEGIDVSDEVEAKIDGDGMDIGWKAEHLLDGLNGTPAATVTLSFAGPTKTALITAESDPGFRYLTMPVRIK